MTENYETWIGEEEDYPEDGDPCRHCGPHCEDWGGDGICMLEGERQARETEDYEARYFRPAAICPVCRHPCPRYDVAADELWLWPGNWYSPMIALFQVYGAYDLPKGELHHEGQVYHIWVGEGEYRDEKLIRLLGKRTGTCLTAS